MNIVVCMFSEIGLENGVGRNRSQYQRVVPSILDHY
jgi:hypothetical protein